MENNGERKREIFVRERGLLGEREKIAREREEKRERERVSFDEHTQF